MSKISIFLLILFIGLSYSDSIKELGKSNKIRRLEVKISEIKIDTFTLELQVGDYYILPFGIENKKLEIFFNGTLDNPTVYEEDGQKIDSSFNDEKYIIEVDNFNFTEDIKYTIKSDTGTVDEINFKGLKIDSISSNIIILTENSSLNVNFNYSFNCFTLKSITIINTGNNNKIEIQNLKSNADMYSFNFSDLTKIPQGEYQIHSFFDKSFYDFIDEKTINYLTINQTEVDYCPEGKKISKIKIQFNEDLSPDLITIMIKDNIKYSNIEIDPTDNSSLFVKNSSELYENDKMNFYIINNCNEQSLMNYIVKFIKIDEVSPTFISYNENKFYIHIKYTQEVSKIDSIELIDNKTGKKATKILSEYFDKAEGKEITIELLPSLNLNSTYKIKTNLINTISFTENIKTITILKCTNHCETCTNTANNCTTCVSKYELLTHSNKIGICYREINDSNAFDVMGENIINFEDYEFLNQKKNFYTLVYTYDNKSNPIQSSNIPNYTKINLTDCEINLYTQNNNNQSIIIAQIFYNGKGNDFEVYALNGTKLNKSSCDYQNNADLIAAVENERNIQEDLKEKAKEEEKEIKNENETIILSVTQVNKSELIPSNKSSSIDLGKCEDVLKNYYHLEELYIIQVSYKVDDSSDFVKFNVYDENGTLLDLSLCDDDEPITILIPVNASFNNKSDYYNSKCYRFGADDENIPLYKRREIYKSLTFCNEGCNFLGVDNVKSVAKCQCTGKTIQSNNKAETAKGKFINDFTNSISSANYDVIFCYNLVFDKEIIKENIGSYVLIILLVANIVNFFIYLKKKLEIFGEFILNKNFPPVKKARKDDQFENGLKIIKEDKKNVKYIAKTKPLGNCNDSSNEFNLGSKLNIQNKSTAQEEIIAKNILGMKGISEDDLDFKYNMNFNNNKTFREAYIEKMKDYHPILHLIYKDDDEIINILIASFLFDLQTDFVSNAFFYEEAYVAHSYELGNVYDFSYNLGKIAISYLFGCAMGMLINLFAANLSYNQYKDSKEKFYTKYYSFELQRKKHADKIRKIINVYFFLIIIFNLGYWYFCSAFCAVYPNNQICWIVDSIVTVVLGMTIPFLTALISVCIRKLSFKFEVELLYLISRIMDLF